MGLERRSRAENRTIRLQIASRFFLVFMHFWAKWLPAQNGSRTEISGWESDHPARNCVKILFCCHVMFMKILCFCYKAISFTKRVNKRDIGLRIGPSGSKLRQDSFWFHCFSKNTLCQPPTSQQIIFAFYLQFAVKTQTDYVYMFWVFDTFFQNPSSLCHRPSRG